MLGPVMASRTIALLLALFGSIHPGLAQAVPASSVDPTLLPTSTASPNLFRVELRNPSAQDLVLNLGIRWLMERSSTQVP
jgi:hypothetical protein